MRHRFAFFAIAALLALVCTACPPSDSRGRKSPTPDPTVPEQPQHAAVQPPPVVNGPPEKQGPPQVRIDAALQHARTLQLLRDHSFWTVFHGILGLGPESAYLLDHRTGEKVKALDYIFKGGAIRGLEFIAVGPDRADVRTMAGTGTGQGHQDQFIAEMAQWGVSRDTRVLVQAKPMTFEAFTLHSKERTSVKSNQELSWAIIIIAQYYGTNISWTNRRGKGETLHFEDVVRYELDQPIKESPVCGGTHRLFGLSWAFHLHMAKGGQKTGVWKEVEDLSRGYIDLAKSLQNKDGSFSTEYFRGAGNNQSDLTLRIHSTGHILEWLALALSDEDIRQPWMAAAADALVVMILNNATRGLDGGAVYHAAHGLEIYRNRVFGPTPHPPLIPAHPR